VVGDNGNDVAFLGAGDDIFDWAPGDGNDTVEGQGGTDQLRFFGSNAAENISVLANGGRVLFTRDIANVTMDLDDVEQIRFSALGAADNVVVGDLTGTDTTLVEINLGASTGGGDGQIDSVTVNATQGDDVVAVALGGGGLSVTGLTANTVMLAAEATDRLTLNGLAGDDVIDASSLAAGNILLTFNGGLGADVLLGSAGDDLFNGGDGDDVALMGAGNDTFVWNPGDDNDTLEGQAGTADTMIFNGAGVAENITISANGGRLLFFRNVASVTMDLNDTEVIEFNALGGIDGITVNDLTGTDVTTVRINLSGAAGGGDGAADTITINGTAGVDNITLTNTGSSVTVTGLPYQILITGFEAGDRIIINTLGGDDTVNGSALDATVAFQADGGENNDTLFGGAAADTLFGGNGNDFLQGNGGVDTLDGGAGTNTVIQ
jgi:Ca2+-binding RTX toxin-like protein